MIRYWQAGLVMAGVCSLFLYVQMIKSDRDDALATIAEMRQDAFKRSIEVKISAQAGKQAVETITGRNKSDIQHIGGLYATEIQKRDAVINNYRRELADRLREHSSSSDSAVQTHDTDIVTGNDCNRAASESDTDYKMMYNGAVEYIHTLKQAGAVCASDYNMCRDYVISEQQRIGVHD